MIFVVLISIHSAQAASTNIPPVLDWIYHAVNQDLPTGEQAKYFDTLEGAVDYRCSVIAWNYSNFDCPTNIEVDESYSSETAKQYSVQFEYDQSGQRRIRYTQVYASLTKLVCPNSHPGPIYLNSDDEIDMCAAPDEDDGAGCGVGNPCNPATGNKFQSELDFFISGLSLVRSYNSRVLANNGQGLGWRSNHQKALLVTQEALTQVSATGRGEPWINVNGVWQGDTDSDVLIIENASGFQLTNANGTVENYSLSGQLLSTLDTNGNQNIYNYNTENQLDQVTNHYGLSISFSYSNGNVASVTDSLGGVYYYEYDLNNNLIAVIYPDTTPNDDSDNPRKIYHYENIDYPNHLTGITDENGNRYATYAYDADGKAITTEHAQTTNSVGQEKFELDYQ